MTEQDSAESVSKAIWTDRTVHTAVARSSAQQAQNMNEKVSQGFYGREHAGIQ